MSTTETTPHAAADEVDALPKVARVGRRPSGKSRAVIEQESSKKRRDRLVKGGKVELKTYVETPTKDRLTSLKSILGKDTLGEVLDALVAQYDAGAASAKTDV